MTHLFFRVKRHGQLTDVEIEHLTPAEREAVLVRYDRAAFIRCVHLLCDQLAHAEQKMRAFDLLEIP